MVKQVFLFEFWGMLQPIDYQLSFSPNIKIHNVFHISILKKYVHDATHVIDWNVIQVEPEGDFSVELDCILDKMEMFLWNHTIGKVKVQWKYLSPYEST